MSGCVAVELLSHRFGDLAVLNDISLTAEAGECVALLGPSGCGKSTLLRILAGLVQPTSGSVRVDGRDIGARPGTVAYMPQSDTLLPWRRALDNATLGAELLGHDRSDSRARATELFERLGLAGFERAWPAQLSGGMRQRVALLRTVLTDLPVLALDEPFAALDAITRRELQGWLADLLSLTQRTTLLVTHDIDEALRLADRVVVMSPRPGAMVGVLTPPGRRPRDPVRVTEPDMAEHKRRVLRLLQPSSR